MSTSLPVYIQISEMLIREVQAGRLADGERLPPEREMAKDLGISVGTLRKALADLTEKGLLERRQGSGNYVRHGGGGTSVYALFRLELAEGGGLPTARILSVDFCEKRSDLPKFGSGPNAYRIRRLRSLGDRLAAVEEIWLCASVAPELRAEDLSESLYLYYKNHLGLWIVRAEDRIGAGQMPEWGAGLIPGAQPVMGLIDRQSWDQYDRVIEISQTWFDSEYIRYVSRI